MRSCQDFNLKYKIDTSAMFYFIGLGLGDANDITVKGLDIIKRCSRVYLEAYTSILTVGKEALVWKTCMKRDFLKT